MKRLLVVFWMVLWGTIQSSQSFCQSGNTDHYSVIDVAIPPAPEAAALGKFIDTPVSLYTGVPTISIPLYELKGKSLSVPVALNYHAGGVRVDETASRVGLSWALSAGGMISRTMRGKPDEDPFGFLNFAQQIPTPFPTYAEEAHPVNDTYYSSQDYNAFENIAEGKKDGEPDMFHISVPGFSARFIFDANGQPRTIPYQAIELIPNWVDKTWCLRLPNGNSYFFGGSEAYDYSTSYIDGTGANSGGVPWISTWYLIRMESSSGEQIHFEYEATGIITEQLTESKTLYHAIISTGTCSAPAAHVVSGYTERNIIRPKRIHHGLGSVEFVYDEVQRQDLSGDYALSEIQIRDQSEGLVKKFVLGHGYWSNRLVLETLVEMHDDCERKPPYLFSYDHSLNMPQKGSFSQDYWGYYNGKSNLSLVPLTKMSQVQNTCIMLGDADRRPDFEFGKLGTLIGIKYPTGAETHFDYEGHTYDAGPIDPGTTELESHSVHAWCTGANCISQACSNCQASESETFTVDFDQCVKVGHIFSTSANECGGRIELADLNGNIIYEHDCHSVSAYSGEIYIWLPSGDYRLTSSATYAGDDAQAYLYLEKYLSQPDGIRELGGLRVKEITQHDPKQPGIDRIQQYRYRFQDDPSRSTGEIDSFPNNFVQLYEEERNASGDITPWYLICEFKTLSSTPVHQPSSTQGSHVGYKEVSVLDGPSGANGKTVSRFTCFSDYPDAISEFPHGAKTSFDHQRGLPLQTKVYDVSGKLKTESLHEYQFEVAGNSSTILATKVGFKRRVTSGTLSGGFTHHLITRPYYIHSAWQYPSKSIHRIYDESGQDYLETTEEYFYNSPAHAFITGKKVRDSEGRSYIEEYSYPQDFSSGGSDNMSLALDRMKDELFMLATPIETRKYVEESPGQPKLMQAMLTIFKIWTKGMVLPEKVYLFETETPVTTFSEAEVDNGQFEMDPAYRLIEEVQGYDECGNLVNAQKINGLRSSFQYGYQSSLPNAKVVNAEVRRPDRYQGQIERIRCKGINSTGANIFCKNVGDIAHWWPESSKATPLPNGDYEVVTTWYREKETTLCSGNTPQVPTGSNWVLAQHNCAWTGTSMYVRSPQDLLNGADNYGLSFSYIGFENGQEFSTEPDNDFWTLNQNNSHDGDAHSGSFSRKVAAGEYGPTRDFRPEEQEDRFYLSAWVKVDPYAAGGKLVIHTKDDVQSPHSVYPSAALYNSYVAANLPATGEWERVEVVLDLEALRASLGISGSNLLRLRCFIDNSQGAGDILIDDIRFQPGKALAESYVYAPMTGLVAQADPNDRYSFFEYDGLQRLRLARDFNRNIRKRMSYNYGEQGTHAGIDLNPSAAPYVNDMVTISANYFTPCMSYPAVEYRWDFGDGQSQISSSASVQHSYAQPGGYSIGLEVVDTRGYVTSATQQINVVYLPLQVEVSGHLIASCGNSYTYQVSVSDGCAPYAYQWYYQESGSTQFSLLTGETTSSLSLNAPAGNYAVRCVVSDCQGASASVQDDFSVISTPMSAALEWNPEGPVDPGQDVVFSCTVSHGCNNLDFAWYYSEDGTNWSMIGGNSVTEVVSAQNDDFKVKVVVSDLYGRTAESISDWITINP